MDKHRLRLQSDNGDHNEFVLPGILFSQRNVGPCVPGVGRDREFQMTGV